MNTTLRKLAALAVVQKILFPKNSTRTWYGAGQGLYGIASPQVAPLRSAQRMDKAMSKAYMPQPPFVDEPASTIRGVAIIQVGPCKGHPFENDLTTLAMTEDLINAKGPTGCPCNYSHGSTSETKTDAATGEAYQIIPDPLGRTIGTITTPRLSPSKQTLIGDLRLSRSCKSLPGADGANVYDWVMAMAKDYPEGVGLSCYFFSIESEPEINEYGEVTANKLRPGGLSSIDLVGRGAATHSGLAALRVRESPIFKITVRAPFIADDSRATRMVILRSAERIAGGRDNSNSYYDICARTILLQNSKMINQVAKALDENGKVDEGGAACLPLQPIPTEFRSDTNGISKVTLFSPADTTPLVNGFVSKMK